MDFTLNCFFFISHFYFFKGSVSQRTLFMCTISMDTPSYLSLIRSHPPRLCPTHARCFLQGQKCPFLCPPHIWGILQELQAALSSPKALHTQNGPITDFAQQAGRSNLAQSSSVSHVCADDITESAREGTNQNVGKGRGFRYKSSWHRCVWRVKKRGRKGNKEREFHQSDIQFNSIQFSFCFQHNIQYQINYNLLQ